MMMMMMVSDTGGPGLCPFVRAGAICFSAVFIQRAAAAARTSSCPGRGEGLLGARTISTESHGSLSLSLSHSLISLSLRLLPSFITSSSSKSSSYRYLSPTWQSGVSPSEGTGATMSDDEDDQVDSEVNVYDGNFDGPDNMGFGPLVPTESERTLMERVRQELKHELKQVTKNPSFLGF